MYRKLLVRLPYSMKSLSSFFLKREKLTQEINISPFVPFHLKGNHFLLKAEGPVEVDEDQITLHFSLNTTIEIQPAAAEFGNVHLPNGGTQVISLHHTGNVPLSITRVVIDNQAFELSPSPALPLQLMPEAKASIEIHFHPSKLGPHRGTFTFWSNELKHPTVNLIGYGAESQVVITDALIQRVLTFFNNANNPQVLVDRIQDDPSFLRAGGATYGMNFQQAAAVLRYRNRLPGKRFTSMEQLDAVYGIGPDTLHDILYSFAGED
jgi:hypothetical protein